MDVKQAGASLDTLISSFNTRIKELQELVIGRNMCAATIVTDLSEIDTAVKALEFQMQSIKDRLREETEAIPKAKKLIEMSVRQQTKLKSMLTHMPSGMHTSIAVSTRNTNNGLVQEINNQNIGFGSSALEEEHAPPAKEKKSRSSPPLWYVTADELDSLSSYMKGRLTLDKVNAAISDMATYAETSAQLISAPKHKLPENAWEKALELRDILKNDAVKGKHFFLESDIKGPALKLDNTGKAILTVLRHLGRINETRIRQHRVITLTKP